MEKAGIRFKDFEEILSNGSVLGNTNLDHDIETLSLESKVGAEVLHYLAREPEERARMEKMSPVQKMVHFGGLEARFLNETSDETNTAIKGPKPVKILKGTGGPSVKSASSGSADAVSANDSFEQCEKELAKDQNIFEPL